MQHDGGQAPGKADEDEDSQRRHKQKEVLVVPPSDAVVHPRTVVVKLLSQEERLETVTARGTLGTSHTRRHTPPHIIASLTPYRHTPPLTPTPSQAHTSTHYPRPHRHTPPHSCHRCCSVTFVEVGRTCKCHTTSSLQ